MHKHKYYKPPKPSTLPQKPLDPQSRPDFITDFTDPDKYKLSELQMIQKKAALQSKNREAAKQSLEERRKKLQMGIIDQETRKIFQTALTSKNIEINPTIRRNLSQMIQYQRQRSCGKNRGSANKSGRKIREEENSQEQNQSQEFQKQIKKTQHFIKKLERAKKQQNITKAVDIILNDKKSPNFGPTKSSPNLTQNTQIAQNSLQPNITESRMSSSSMSQQQTLSNIEQTIKFMEQKLFNPKSWNKNIGDNRNKNIGGNGNKKVEKNGNVGFKDEKTVEDIKCSTISQISHDFTQNQFLNGFHSGRNTGVNVFGSPNSDFLKHQENQEEQSSFDMEGHLAALKLNFNKNTNLPNFNFFQSQSGQNKPNKNNFMHEEEQQEEDDCMATIRKMKDMMQSKTSQYDNSECHRQKENFKNYNSQRSHKSLKSEGEAEVDFSLTLNQQEIMENNSFSSPHIKVNPVKKSNNYLEVPVSQNQNNIRTGFGTTQQNGYEQLKKSLFDEIDRLEEQSKMTSSKISSNNMTSSKISSNNFNNMKEGLSKHHIMRCDEEDDEEQCSYDIPVQYQFKKKQPTNQNNKQKVDQNIQYSQWPQAQTKMTNINSHPTSLSSISAPQRYTPINKAPQLQIPTINKDLQSLKSLVQGAKKNVNNINIQKSQANPNNPNSKGSIMGFDYRGSINIKKHIVHSQQ